MVNKRGTRALTLAIDNKVCSRSKRSQMKLSFGMIFSIILIIVFISFAFYAIKTFLGISDEARIVKFVDDLQLDIKKIWKGSQASQEVKYSLPNKVEAVCFVDDEYENLIFKSESYFSGGKIQYINFETMGEELCIENVDGKVKMILKKNFEERLVTITEP